MASGGQAYPAKVVSGSGAGPYMMQLNPQASSPGPTVSVNIPQLDSSQTIPAGTYLLVVQVGTSYYSQPPVWLAPA